MRIYNGTGCIVYLVGNLCTTPMIEQNFSHDVVIIVSRQNFFSDVVEHYRVIVNSIDAYRLLKYGYIGMSLSIQGDLRVIEERTDVVAEKIDFYDFPTSNQFDAHSFLLINPADDDCLSSKIND